jgi:hypothetical protein
VPNWAKALQRGNYAASFDFWWLDSRRDAGNGVAQCEA